MKAGNETPKAMYLYNPYFEVYFDIIKPMPRFKRWLWRMLGFEYRGGIVMKSEDWIKVEDMLPDENVAVLLLSNKRAVAVGILDDGDWLVNNESHVFRLSTFTHWMPIVLPKEEK